MAKDRLPYFNFYPNDWIGGTMGMGLEEKGAYIELLIMQWNVGHMTSHMIGQQVGQVWLKIQHKFVQDDDGKWYNERLEEEKEKRKRYIESRKNNKKGKNQHSSQKKHMTGHMTSHMENENENENEYKLIEKEFEDFWEMYDKKVSRKPCMKKFKRLKKSEREKIFATLPRFLELHPDKQYLPHPSTYLNQKRWEDDLESLKTKNQPKPVEWK